MKNMAIKELEQKIKNVLRDFQGDAGLLIEAAGEQIALNENRQMRAASVIKLPILIEGYRQLDSGKVSRTEKIAMEPSDLVYGSGVLFHLESIKQLSMYDILTLMTIVSDNTASNIAIKKLGFDAINKFCEKAGCTETHLGRRFMDFEAAAKGIDNVTSAQDMVALLKAADSGEFLTEDSRKRVIHTLKQQQLMANLHGRIEEDSEVSIASKSGSLPGVVNDVGIFQYKGKKVYVGVLLGNLEDNHSGQELIAEIGWLVHNYLLANEKIR